MPVLLLVKIELLQAAVQILALIVPGVGRVMLAQSQQIFHD